MLKSGITGGKTQSKRRRNIRKRKDGRWGGHHSAGYDSNIGKPIIKNVLVKTHAEEKEKFQVIFQEVQTLDFIRSDGCAVEE